MNKFKDESVLMRICRAFGMERTAWSLRRVYCPVDRSALVLEVGSGGNPYFRSNVLLDAFETTRQRHWAPLVTDRPTVLGNVERLPFRDGAFDFVIASHVLEHSPDPVAFLSELQRVAKSGYIEVPDAFMERLNPYKDHRLEITERNNSLIIRKKADWVMDLELNELYEAEAKSIVTQKLIPNHPFAFHVRYYWSGSIDMEVLNPEIESNWNAPHGDEPMRSVSLRSKVNAGILKVVRTLLSQNSRNKSIDLGSLLACPACRSDDLSVTERVIECRNCATQYSIDNGLPRMFTDLP